jgi:hypothetical protein
VWSRALQCDPGRYHEHHHPYESLTVFAPLVPEAETRMVEPRLLLARPGTRTASPGVLLPLLLRRQFAERGSIATGAREAGAHLHSSRTQPRLEAFAESVRTRSKARESCCCFQQMSRTAMWMLTPNNRGARSSPHAPFHGKTSGAGERGDVGVSALVGAASVAPSSVPAGNEKNGRSLAAVPVGASSTSTAIETEFA